MRYLILISFLIVGFSVNARANVVVCQSETPSFKVIMEMEGATGNAQVFKNNVSQWKGPVQCSMEQRGPEGSDFEIFCFATNGATYWMALRPNRSTNELEFMNLGQGNFSEAHLLAQLTCR